MRQSKASRRQRLERWVTSFSAILAAFGYTRARVSSYFGRGCSSRPLLPLLQAFVCMPFVPLPLLGSNDFLLAGSSSLPTLVDLRDSVFRHFNAVADESPP
jgi:hypothetical protein